MKFRHRTVHSILICIVFVLIATTATFSQGTPSDSGAKKVPSDSGVICTGGKCPQVANPNAQNSGFNLDIKISNPLKVNTIQDAIKLFVNAVVRLAIPVIVIFFLWSGLRFIFARGNPTEVGKAKNMFFYTVIGTLLILGAWTITNAIIGTVNSITN